jgi:hypothetical protein
MRGLKFTETQIVSILKEADTFDQTYCDCRSSPSRANHLRIVIVLC